MNEISSKICQVCFSTQAESSRFCDNCGNHFVERVSSIEDTMFASKSFIGRQVKETRPLFWASIIIVGALSVFGFAKAGGFKSFTGAALLGGFQLKPEDTTAKRGETSNPISARNENVSDALIDSAGNVFDMGHSSASSAPEQRTRLAERTVKTKIKNEAVTKTEVTSETPGDDLGVAFVEKPSISKVKTTDEASGTKNYVRGPMGGCFYLTATGGKRYVDRSMCK